MFFSISNVLSFMPNTAGAGFTKRGPCLIQMLKCGALALASFLCHFLLYRDALL